jgi:hypothetical protein
MSPAPLLSPSRLARRGRLCQAIAVAFLAALAGCVEDPSAPVSEAGEAFELQSKDVEADLLRPRPQAKGPCQPTAGGPHWLEERQRLAIKVVCGTGRPLDGHEVRVARLPAGAIFDPAAAEIRWTPGLADAGVYVLDLEVPGTRERGAVVVGVADRFDDPANAPVEPTRYTHDLGLPVLHLAIAPKQDRDGYSKTSLTFLGHTYAAEARIRGATSATYPKKSYTVKFSRGDLFQAPARGFVRKRKLTLLASFDDNSHLRTRLAFELWNRLARTGVQVQTFSAAVFEGGKYQGIYVVADHVDEELLAAQGLGTGGQLFKAVAHEANFTSTEGLPEAYEKKAGLPEAGEAGAFAPLAALTELVSGADDATFRARIGEAVDLRDYGAWFILVTAIQAGDSLAKNAYHAQGPGGAPWRVIPWDFNHSFGQTWSTDREAPTAKLAEQAAWNRLFARWLADPDLGAALRARYRAALAGELRLPDLLARVDALAAELGPGARRDDRRWGEAQRSFPLWRDRIDFTDFAGEVAHVKRWIEARWQVLAGELGAP